MYATKLLQGRSRYSEAMLSVSANVFDEVLEVLKDVPPMIPRRPVVM